MYGDFNYKPKWSESNRNCELRYLDLPLAFALTKELLGAPGLSNRPVDPFQEHKPLFVLGPLFMNDLKRIMDRPVCDACGRSECRGCQYPLT